jgi:hypothetical protein
MDQLQLKWAFPFAAAVMLLGVVGFWCWSGGASAFPDTHDHPATDHH